jgi:hypothetical protein
MEEVLPDQQCTGLMKIMTKQATNWARTIKLPDSQYTQNGRETLKQLFKDHFPDSKLTDCSGDQGQQNLGVCKGTMKAGDWNLVK